VDETDPYHRWRLTEFSLQWSGALLPRCDRHEQMRHCCDEEIRRSRAIRIMQAAPDDIAGRSGSSRPCANKSKKTGQALNLAARRAYS
jgi:hypothetical protein